MPKIEGLQRVISALQAKAAAATKDTDVSVVVGYTAAYALYVHEDLSKAHGDAYNEKWADDIAAGRKTSRGSGQQAKFLEQPMRERKEELRAIVTKALQQGKTMGQALLLAGLALQRWSQQICPVDTGVLRESAFTRLETGTGSVG